MLVQSDSQQSYDLESFSFVRITRARIAIYTDSAFSFFADAATVTGPPQGMRSATQAAGSGCFRMQSDELPSAGETNCSNRCVRDAASASVGEGAGQPQWRRTRPGRRVGFDCPATSKVGSACRCLHAQRCKYDVPALNRVRYSVRCRERSFELAHDVVPTRRQLSRVASCWVVVGSCCKTHFRWRRLHFAQLA
jgi:hypothetical protein